MTAKELINASGRLIGELRTGRSFSDDELADLLVSLNNMLGEWSEEQTGIFSVTLDSITLTGATDYQFPATANAAQRPVRILNAVTRTAAGVEQPAQVVDSSVWSARVLDRNETGLCAEMVWPDHAHPQIRLAVWPVVAAGTLILRSLRPLTAFAALTDTVTFPPGYEEALVYGFAVKIAPEFLKEPSQTVVMVAQRAREAITKTNAQLLPAAA